MITDNVSTQKAMFMRHAAEHSKNDTAWSEYVKQYLAGLRSLDGEMIARGEDMSPYNFEAEVEADLAAKVKEVLPLEGVQVILADRWLWCGGETKQHKEELKKFGFLFSPKKAMWYYRHGKNKWYKRGGESNFGIIAAKYNAAYARQEA